MFPSSRPAIMAPGNVAKCPPQEEGGINNGEVISRQEGKIKESLSGSRGKRDERERERDTYNGRFQCPCINLFAHLDSNVKTGEDGRGKLPLLIERLKQRELVFLYHFGTLEGCLSQGAPTSF